MTYGNDSHSAIINVQKEVVKWNRQNSYKFIISNSSSIQRKENVKQLHGLYHLSSQQPGLWIQIFRAEPFGVTSVSADLAETQFSLL